MNRSPKLGKYGIAGLAGGESCGQPGYTPGVLEIYLPAIEITI